MNVRELTSWIASLCSIALWLTGILTCQKIRRQGHTTNVSFFPFLCMFCGTTVWTKYGLLKSEPTLYLVNGAGAVINFTFIFVYYIYTYQKGFLHKQLLVGVALLFPILLYVKLQTHSAEEAIRILGLYCSSMSVLTYGSPLAALSDVYKSRSTEVLSLPLCLANLVVAIEWWFYGHIMDDMYIKIPNILGTILSSFQLSLFCIYPSRSAEAKKKSIIVT